MLKKLTSPKAKGAARASGDAKRSSADKELSGLAAAPDDGDFTRDNADAASSKAGKRKPSAGAASAEKTGKPKKRDELSLDMSALTESAAEGGEDQLSLVDERTISKEKASSGDRRKTLVRSPRTKSILDEQGGAADDATPTLQGKRDAKPKPSADAAAKETPSSPAKEEKSKKSAKKTGFSGLKALKSSKPKEDAAASSDEKQPAVADDSAGGEEKQTSGDTKQNTRKNAEGNKSESKMVDEADDATVSREHNRGDSNHRSGESQKTKSSLSPLRRRKVAQDSDEAAPSQSKNEQLLKHRTKPRDLPPANQPEVHIVGEIVSGESFGSGGFACKWGVEYGSLWHHIAGDQLGQTQIDYPASSSHPIVWSHPIDLHFATTSFSGWPKLLLQVWQTDTHMKANVVGYGFINLPFSPGEHQLSVSLWRPMGSAKEEMEAKLLGRTPELVNEEVVFSAAWADRCRLQTTATGKVHLQVGILLRNFQMSDLEM